MAGANAHNARRGAELGLKFVALGSGVFDRMDPLPAAGAQGALQVQFLCCTSLPFFLSIRGSSFDALTHGFQLGGGLDAVYPRVPIRWRIDGPILLKHQPWRSLLLPPGQARPRPSSGRCYQIRTQGVSLDVSADDQQVLIALDRKAFESSLVQRAGAGGVMMGVPTLGVGHGQQPHELAQLIVLARPQHQVPVIGHQAVAEDSHRDRKTGAFDDPLHGQVIGIVFKQSPATHRPVQHMIKHPSARGSQSSGHKTSLPSGKVSYCNDF